MNGKSHDSGVEDSIDADVFFGGAGHRPAPPIAIRIWINSEPTSRRRHSAAPERKRA